MKPAVIITGVLGGIGQALAEEFRVANFYVIGLDIKEGESRFCDLYHGFDIKRYVEDEQYYDKQNDWFRIHVKRLSALVNNAAVQRLGGIDDLSLADWNETMAVNVTGPLRLSQFFVPLLEPNDGCIVNIASIHHQLTKKRFISYATSKSALIGLTKALSVDLSGRVRVNSISPAAIDTMMLREGFDFDEEKVRQLNELHPSQRIGQPNEVAKLSVFIAQNHFNFINGANIEMDGAISNVLKDLD